MGTHPRHEVEATVERYRAVREAIERGEQTWTDLGQFFTDDAVYIDPAWGRIQGHAEIVAFFEESMRGLDDWRFPIQFTAVQGDDVVITWFQILPGSKPDGSPWQQSGVSTLIYAGDGRFSFEEDLLNMAHVMEDLAAGGWSPPAGFAFPPARPDRDTTRP